jgi:hypothetical protein
VYCLFVLQCVTNYVMHAKIIKFFVICINITFPSHFLHRPNRGLTKVLNLIHAVARVGISRSC